MRILCLGNFIISRLNGNNLISSLQFIATVKSATSQNKLLQFKTGQESLQSLFCKSSSRKTQRDSWYQEGQRHHHSHLHKSLITSRGSKLFSRTSIYSLPLMFLNLSWFPLLFLDLYKVVPSPITTRLKTLLNLDSFSKRLPLRAVSLTVFSSAEGQSKSIFIFSIFSFAKSL